MGFFDIMKTAKHQRFNYIPRHYDPDKEDLKRRVEAAQNKGTADPEAAKARISASLRHSRNANPKLRSQAVFRSNILLLIIIVLLVIIVFMMINVYLPQIEGMMGGVK